MVAEIHLTRGYTALVDDDDLPRLAPFRWKVRFDSKIGEALQYADAKYRDDDGEHYIQMHRLILDAPPDLVVDHINGCGLDNRKSNLRLATIAQNMQSRRTGIGLTGYRGVDQKMPGRYRARIWVYGTVKRLGTFGRADLAARAYDAGARKYFGEFACLNFPEPGEKSARPQGAANTLGADLIQSSHEAAFVHGSNHPMETEACPSTKRSGS